MSLLFFVSSDVSASKVLCVCASRELPELPTLVCTCKKVLASNRADRLVDAWHFLIDFWLFVTWLIAC